MSRKREVRELIQAIERNPDYFVVQARRSGHWHVRRRSTGELVKVLPGSPDGPFRARAVADLKRLGIIECDPKLVGQMARDKRV